MIIERHLPVLKLALACGAVAAGVIALRRLLQMKNKPRVDVEREVVLRAAQQVPWGVEV